MMKKCLALCAVLVSGMSSLMAQGVNLHFKHVSGEGVQQAQGVLIDKKGTIASVALVQANPSLASMKGVDGKDIALEIVVHDPVSRLTLLRVPQSALGDTVEASVAEVENLHAAQAVKLGEQQKQSRVVSLDKRFDGKTLPLSLYRINHAYENVKPGTPLYNEEGQLVALTHQAVVDAKQSTYALPIEVLKRVMADHQKQGKVLRCWVGIALNARNDAPVVTGVRPDSPAKKAGIQSGDVLVTIDGKAVTEYADVVNRFYYLVAEKAVTFKVLRGTEVLEMKVLPEVSPVLR